MVDAIVSFALENLLNVAKDEAVQLASLKENLEDLSGDLGMIQAVIRDAEMKQIKDETITIWLRNLKYVAYDIEDVLYKWDQVRNLSPFSYPKRLIKQFKFAHKTTSIKKRLEKIKSQKDTYGFCKISVRETDQERETFAAVVEQSSIFGRDANKEILISKLVENDPSWTVGKIPVISIVGMGGLGKTTLAQILFHNEAIKDHFHERIWVFVSNEFQTKDIMIKIVKNGGGSIDKEDTLDSISKQVLKIIENKRYLLVLDDVWNEHEQMWEPLHNVLDSGTRDSRIIVTTRNTGVANAIRSEYINNLGFLSEEDCWSIFKKTVFVRNHDQGYNDLEEIGKLIIEKCGGIPLAVKTIASAIRKKAGGRKPTVEQLNDILSNEIWDVSMASNISILPALMLSYLELPSALKNCFCYCSLFEKGDILQKDFLVKSWVAQGYIKEKDGQKVECIGEDCFDELLDRSLFQEPEKDEYGTVTSCKMHDLVHDIALWVCKTEFSTLRMERSGKKALTLGDARHCTILGAVEWKGDGIENLRSLICKSQLSNSCEIPFSAIPRLRSVRVLSLNYLDWSRKVKFDVFERLVHLRYLNLSSTTIYQLPTSIEKLKHLLYLDLTNTRISELPRSIGKLKHLLCLDLSKTTISELPESITYLPRLQTLNLSQCQNLKKLPDRIPEMSSLRQLDVSNCWSLEKLPDGIGRVTLLQTLGMFPIIVEGRGCSNIGELGRLNNLRHELFIDNLEAVASIDEALTAKLRDKTSLWSLRLWWNSKKDGVNYTGVLEGLHPPPGIAELVIFGYPGEAFPSWMGDATSFLHLCQVRLEYCKFCTQLPPLGRLPCLIKLTIAGLYMVETMGDEFLFGFGDESGNCSSMVAFPKLESLQFYTMEKWESWTSSLAPPSEEGSSTPMPRLSELLLIHCPKLKEVPSIFTHKVKKLILNGCALEQQTR